MNIREIQIKSTLRFHLAPLKWGRSTKQWTTKAGEDVEESFRTGKIITDIVKQKPREWKRIIVSCTPDRGFISRIHKE